MIDAVDFSILAAIPSGPDALLVSKACSNSSISSSEQRSSGGYRSGCTRIWSISEVSSGGSDRLKQLEKNWFNIDAFSLLDEAVELLCRRVGIEEDELFNFFIALQNFLVFEDRLHNFFMYFFFAPRRFETSLLCSSQYL